MTDTADAAGGAAGGHLTGIDHLVLAVRDLEAAAATFRRLGFTITPRGRHRDMATGNYCIMFGPDYLELIGIIDPDKPDRGLRARMDQRGEGPDRTAFTTDDVAACAAALRSAGIDCTGPLDLRRPLELPTGEVEPRFRLVTLPPGTAPVLNGFVCYHDTPAMVRTPEWLSHANRTRRMTALWSVTDDAPSLHRAWAALAGDDALTLCDGGFSLQTGRMTAHFLSRAALQAAQPELDMTALPAMDCMVGVDLAVADLSATRSALASGGVPFTECRDGAVLVQPADAHGTAIRFVSDE